MITELKNTITILQQVIKNLVDDDEIENLEQTITIINRQIEQIERRK
jgi:hypothetical protein